MWSTDLPFLTTVYTSVSAWIAAIALPVLSNKLAKDILFHGMDDLQFYIFFNSISVISGYVSHMVG